MGVQSARNSQGMRDYLDSAFIGPRVATTIPKWQSQVRGGTTLQQTLARGSLTARFACWVHIKLDTVADFLNLPIREELARIAFPVATVEPEIQPVFAMALAAILACDPNHIVKSYKGGSTISVDTSWVPSWARAWKKAIAIETMLAKTSFGEISVDSLQAMRIGFLLGPLLVPG